MSMKANGISEHLCRVYVFVRERGDWTTAHEIAKSARVAPRTARAHALRLVKAGIFDLVAVFPGHHYRVASNAAQRNRGFMQRLEHAAAVFGHADSARRHGKTEN